MDHIGRQSHMPAPEYNGVGMPIDRTNPQTNTGEPGRGDRQ